MPENRQILSKFIPVLRIQASSNICHQFVKTKGKPLMLIHWLQDDAKKV
jgi:hypothetical protein